MSYDVHYCNNPKMVVVEVPGKFLGLGPFVTYYQEAGIEDCALAAELLEVEGVKSVQFLREKVRLEREDWANWERMIPSILLSLEGYFDENAGTECPGLSVSSR